MKTLMMMIDKALNTVGRLLMLFFAAHWIAAATVCFYFAWKVAPFWIVAIPAALFGSLFLFIAASRIIDEIRRPQSFL